MKALDATRSGTVELAEVAAPTVGTGEALVEVRAISLNRGELHRFAMPRPAGARAGDFVGVVAASGDASTASAIGERVFGAVPGAAWAELVAVPAGYIAPLPDELSFVQGAALPVAGLTALRILELGGPLEGARVLVVWEESDAAPAALRAREVAGKAVLTLERRDGTA